MYEAKSATGSSAFHSFFKERPGPLQIYRTTLDDHASRRVIEVALQFVTGEEWNMGRMGKLA